MLLYMLMMMLLIEVLAPKKRSTSDKKHQRSRATLQRRCEDTCFNQQEYNDINIIVQKYDEIYT